MQKNPGKSLRRHVVVGRDSMVAHDPADHPRFASTAESSSLTEYMRLVIFVWIPTYTHRYFQYAAWPILPALSNVCRLTDTAVPYPLVPKPATDEQGQRTYPRTKAISRGAVFWFFLLTESSII